MATITTLAQLPLLVADRPDTPGLVGRCHASGTEAWSSREFSAQVFALHAALRELGVQPGDRVAIMSESRPEWTMADLAILTARGVTVTIYPTLVAAQAAYILADAGCTYAFLSDRAQLDKIREAARTAPALRAVVALAPEAAAGTQPDGGLAVYALSELLERQSGQAYSALEQACRAEALKVQPDDLATLIYTSGTTGDPKGVMLTHHNIVSNMLAAGQVLVMTPSDVSLSFLPLSHSFERLVMYLYLHQGVTVRFAESLETIARDLLQVRPTIMTGVPRVYEKFQSRVLETIAAAPARRQALFRWAYGVGRTWAEARRGERPATAFLRVCHAVADRLVLSKVRARLGGRLRLLVSGGAPLAGSTGEFFHAMGLMLVEGYGLTETSPVLAVNPLDAVRLGTVGPPIPGVELKIADDGEILARGPNVMRGYYNKPDATREALAGGWFHTGDIGELDERGYLRITDRKKDLIVTSGGKKIAPQPIEAALKADPLVAEAVLLGDRRKFVAALVVPAFAALEARAKEMGLAGASRAALVGRPEVASLYQVIIDRVNEGLGQFERIKKFALLPAEFSVASGELTPTMKVRRKVVEERWRGEIEQIYGGSG